MNSYDTFPRVNRILTDREYLKYIHEIEELEQDRIFCRHNMEHFLSVARIACLLNYEEGTCVDRELIYAASLLHDIGRGKEYLTGVRHEEESARLAPHIIRRAGFSKEEEALLISAIANHRNHKYSDKVKGKVTDKSNETDTGRPDSDDMEEERLNSLIYRADKLSRACFYCEASDKCHKSEDKKNIELLI